MKKIASVWGDLNRSIYTGSRLKSNLLALTLVSIVSAVLGAVLIVIDIITKQQMMLIASIATFVAGVACAVCAGILKTEK